MSTKQFTILFKICKRSKRVKIYERLMNGNLTPTSYKWLLTFFVGKVMFKNRNKQANEIVKRVVPYKGGKNLHGF